MNRCSRLVCAVAALATVGATCTAQSPPAPPSPPPPVRLPGIPVGGVLKTQIVSDVSAAFDPQKEYYPLTFELFRCCLLRTLLAGNGKDAQHGGNELRPDLALSLPAVSADGLTWTFHLKPGIHYAPPLQNLTVTSRDFVRALEREACADCATGGYSFYYGGGHLGAGIKGFDDYASGKSTTISGLATPDESTLLVSLDHPTGDLGWRFALAATAPIPPNPADPSAPLGVATRHTQDYGRFLATTGPYVFRWQSKLRYTADGKNEQPIRGYRPGRSITLVRNPSWSPSTDDLRPAYLDEIDITIGEYPEAVTAKVERGQLDIGLDSSPLSSDLKCSGCEPDPHLIHTYPANAVQFLSFNLAIPPFDDVHVRRAVNYAIDKAEMLRLASSSDLPISGTIATHAIPDALETVRDHALLAGFDPYATPNHTGDLAKAHHEMKLSKYDANGDGMCDATTCAHLRAIYDEANPYAREVIAEDLAPLGMTMTFPTARYIGVGGIDFCHDPRLHLAMCLGEGWHAEYPDAFTWAPLFGSFGLPPRCCNTSLLGAGFEFLSQNHYPKFLRRYRYRLPALPTVDADIYRCVLLTGDRRVRCWADLDRKLMTEIVPWVPYLFVNHVTLTSERVRNFTWDAFAGVASLDHLAVSEN